MSELLSKFSFKYYKAGADIYLLCVLLWLIVVGCAISSVLAQPFSGRQRFFWILLIVALPGIGILAYLPFSIRKEDLPQLFAPRPRPPRKSSNKSLQHRP